MANNTDVIDGNIFVVGCNLAVEDAIEKYREAFTLATRTVTPSRYPRILCSCAFAQHDDRGVFRATDVVDAMRVVFNEFTTVQAVVPALGHFTTPDRGKVLEGINIRGRKQYRFDDPMMRPFLRIKAQSLQ